MDGAEVAVNSLCLARPCATCGCPCDQCQCRRMAEVIEELDAVRDALLDQDDAGQG